MCEFCICIPKNKIKIKDFVLEKCSEFAKEYSGVATIYEKASEYLVLLAVNSYEKNALNLFLHELICEVVCFHYKKDFLTNNLTINISDKITKHAFIFALLYFDKETDRFIVNKYINLDKKIDIDSFFHFKLKPLKEKWQEMINIANQNEIYLYSNETFTELIKFLIDNLEVKNDVINIMKTKESFGIFDANFNEIKTQNLKEEDFMAQIITMSPKNINIYCSDIIPNNLKTLICKLFEKRVRFFSNVY